ncbi:MAG: FeoB-associated Cys-rich membrane protein [Planctomycetia bacterium]|nr:FeoB-associated Cys-rich membrane protein [Planctomycetia bacterium]
MSTTLQLIVVGLIVACAAGYIVRAMWKTWIGKSKANCGSGCGKCAAPAPDHNANSNTNTNGRHPLPMA